MVLRSATTAKSSATSGQIASNLPVACGAGAATYTKRIRRRWKHLQQRHAATASWRKERKLIPLIIGAAAMRRRKCSKVNRREHPRLRREGCSLPTSVPQVCPSRRRSKKHRATAAVTSTSVCSGRSSHKGSERLCAFAAPTTTGNRSVSSGS
jgi:hypothetical protein